MKRAYITVHPGLINQNIFIHNDDNTDIEKFTCGMNEVADFLFNSKIDETVLSGSVPYCEKIQRGIREKEFTHYGKNVMKITLGGF